MHANFAPIFPILIGQAFSTDTLNAIFTRNFAVSKNFAKGMNDQSSRSHSIFQIKVQINSNNSKVQRNIKCCASLIDLAGSERSSTAQTTGKRLREGNAINQSLLTLGKVIKILAEREIKEKQFIPYRDSGIAQNRVQRNFT